MINKVIARSNTGLTLVEVLVSIILISIILVTFFSLFIHSAKIGKTSEEVVETTYLAQVEMERIYEVSRKGDFNYGIQEITESLGYKQLASTNPEEYIFENSIDGFYIKLKLKKHSYQGLNYLVIEVFEQDNGPSRAKMETILEWGL